MSRSVVIHKSKLHFNPKLLNYLINFVLHFYAHHPTCPIWHYINKDTILMYFNLFPTPFLFYRKLQNQ